MAERLPCRFSVRRLGRYGQIAIGDNGSPEEWLPSSSMVYSETEEFVENDALCQAFARDRDGWHFVFWMRADTLVAGVGVGGNNPVEVMHDVPDGLLRLLAVFAESPDTTQTLVVATDGQLYGSLRLEYANGNKIDPAFSWPDDRAGYRHETYAIPASVSRVRATPVPDAGHKGVFDGYAVVDDTGQGEWSRPGEPFYIPLPQQGGTRKVVAAEFRAAEPRTLTFDAPQDGGTARVASSQYGEGAGADAGKWYEGEINVAITPAAGRRVASATLTRTYVEAVGEEPQTDVTPLDVEDNSVAFEMVGDGEFSLSWTEADVVYAFNVRLDEASKGHGAAMAVRYTDPDGATQEATGGVSTGFSGKTTYGNAVTITITPDPNGTGVAIRRVMLSDGDADDEDITGRVETTTQGPPATYECEAIVNGDFTVTVFLGNTLSVGTASMTAGAAATGTAGASLSPDGQFASSVDFTYGDTVYLKAANGGADDPCGTFAAWLKSGEGYPAGVLLGLGADAEHVPTNETAIDALFGSPDDRVFVRITNNGQNYGNIGLFAASGESGNVTEIVAGQGTTAEEEFVAALLEHGHLPDEQNGGSLRPAASAGSGEALFTPHGTEDRFYSVRPGANVVAACDPIADAPASFGGFKLKRYTEKRGSGEEAAPVVSGVEEPMPPGERSAFAATLSGVIVAKWANSEPRQIGAFLGTGMDGRGTVSLAPWPPFSNRSSTELGMGGKYKPGTIVQVSVSAAAGWKFAGWFTDAGMTSQLVRDDSPVGAAFTHEVKETDEDATYYYAKFTECEWVPLVWEGGTENMEAVWRSRRFEAGQPLELTSARIEADGYPVDLKVCYASSPKAGEGEWREAAITVGSQDSRRLPMGRPERFTEIEVRAVAPVLKVAASTSMAGLIG